MAGTLAKIYAVSPVWVQNLGATAYGVVWRHRRFGGDFERLVPEFENRDAWSKDQWLQYQTENLRKLLVHAIETVPHYRRVLLKVATRAELERFNIVDLERLPLIEKSVIRENPNVFVSDTVSSRRIHTYHTSGTTGTPLAVKFTNQTHRKISAAYEARVRRWAGVDFRMSRAMFGGRIVAPQARSSPPFWRYNMVERQLYMSAFHISAESARHYVDALNRYQPDYLVGYASSQFFLARFICEQRLDVHRPRAILTSSEKLTPEMRAVLTRAYQCRVFDGYSGLESCCLASECSEGQLHISPDVGIVELLDDDGRPVEPGQPGHVVATGLLNFDQPLIRYRTGDLAVLTRTKCPCGREMPGLEEIVGRLEDTVIAPDGREMVRFHGIFLDLPKVIEGQVVQETLTCFRLRLVVSRGFGESERSEIRRRFHERLGDIDLNFELVDRIDRTERGKFRSVVSKVTRRDLTKID